MDTRSWDVEIIRVSIWDYPQEQKVSHKARKLFLQAAVRLNCLQKDFKCKMWVPPLCSEEGQYSFTCSFPSSVKVSFNAFPTEPGYFQTFLWRRKMEQKLLRGPEIRPLFWRVLFLASLNRSEIASGRKERRGKHRVVGGGGCQTGNWSTDFNKVSLCYTPGPTFSTSVQYISPANGKPRIHRSHLCTPDNHFGVTRNMFQHRGGRLNSPDVEGSSVHLSSLPSHSRMPSTFLSWVQWEFLQCSYSSPSPKPPASIHPP